MDEKKSDKEIAKDGKEIKEIKKRKKIYIFIGDVIRFVIWVCYLIKVYNWNIKCFNLDSYIISIFPYKWTIILLALILTFLILLIKKKKFWESLFFSIGYIIKFFWRLLIFPIRFIVISVKFFIKMLDLINKLLKLSKSLEVQVVSFILFIISLVVITQTNKDFLLQISMGFMFLFVFVLWTTLYMWTKNPYGFVYRLKRIFSKIWSVLKEKFILNELKTEGSKKPNAKNKLDAKKNLWYGIRFLNWCKRKWNRGIDKKILLEQFFVLLLVIVLITIISFAYGFFALQKVNPNSLKGISENIWEFIYFATITFFNFDIGSYVVGGVGARILIIVELFSILFFLTIIILTFNTIAIDRAKKTVGELLLSIKSKKDELLNILKENYQLAEEEILQYKKEDFEKEEKEIKNKDKKNTKEKWIKKDLHNKYSDEIEKRLMVYKSSDSWEEASKNAKSLLELKNKLKAEDILKIVDITLDNDQILNSYKARNYLKDFFIKNASIIPKDKLKKFLER